MVAPIKFEKGCALKFYADIKKKRNHFKAVLRIASKIGQIKPSNLAANENIVTNQVNTAQNLGTLLRDFGSDKSSVHSYDHIYETKLMNFINQKGILVEIGIGTQNSSIPSHMPSQFKPGGSLKAFESFLPQFTILGADIDSEILINQGRIKCFHLDQLELSSFDELIRAIAVDNNPLRCIIVDGLHQPIADLNSVIKLLPMLVPGGVCFVEDVRLSTLGKIIWKIAVYKLKKSGFQVSIWRADNGDLIEIANPAISIAERI